MTMQNRGSQKDAKGKLTLSKEVGYYTHGKYRSLQNLPKSNDRLFLRYAGEEWCEPGYYFNIPREEYHLHFVLEGKGVFKYGGKRYRLKAGDMFLVPQNQPNFYIADEHQPWHYMWIAIGGDNAWPCLQKAGFSGNCLVRKVNIPIEQYVRLVYEILKYPQLTYAHTLRRMGILYEMLSLLIKSNADKIDQPTLHAHVETAMKLVQENFQSCTVAELADSLCITRNYMFTLFKQELNMSPQQYITKYRMEKAASKLANTEKRVTDIAHAVGYDDPLSFTKAFKKIYKTSPLAYRKAMVPKDKNTD